MTAQSRDAWLTFGVSVPLTVNSQTYSVQTATLFQLGHYALMALRAALALADVCIMNFLVIILYEVVTQGIDIDGVSMLRANFTKGRTLFGFDSVHFHATISPWRSLMKLTMIS